MKRGVVLAALIVATLVLQHLIGHPRVAIAVTALLLPMPWIVGPPLLGLDRRWYWLSFGIGLGWDLVFEPAIGIGMIAWSAAALVVHGLSGVVAKQKAGAWFAFGSAGALVFWLTLGLVGMTIGMPLGAPWIHLLLSALLTGFWCLIVYLAIAFNAPQRWRLVRARRLR